MKKIMKTTVLAFVLLIQTLSFAQVDTKQLDAYIEKARVDFDLPGLSIAVVNKDKVLYQNSFGYSNQADEIALQNQSIFGIASLSKAFTAAGIAMLVDEGKLNWQDQVRDHLPSFKLSDEYVASKMTIEDLLSHRSGFKTFDGDLLWYGTNYSRDEIVERFSKFPLSEEHRSRYGYQNIMFIVAGEVIEEISGLSWDEFVETRILNPLGMNNTFTSINKFPNTVSIAMPHVKGKLDELRNYDNSGGAAALSSNTNDLSNWLKFWLNKGIVNGDTLLSAASFQKIMSMHISWPSSNYDQSIGVEFNGYGLGWFLMDYSGSKVAHHGGGLPGYISKIAFVKEKDLGIIVLTNGETSLPSALMYHCIDVFTENGSEADWATTYLDYKKRYEKYLASKEDKRKEARNPKLKSNLDLEDALGIYEDEVYGDAEISKVGNDMVLSLLPSKEIFTSKLIHWQQNTYQIKFKDAFLPPGYITFDLNADGKILGFKIDLPNPDFHFHKRDFIKQP